MIKVAKFIVMLRTLLKQTKFQLNIKGPEKKNTYVPSQKNKNLMKCLACDEQKHKVRPLPLATISLTEKVEKTLREYFELHIKNHNVKYIDESNRILVLNTKSLLAAGVAYHISCYTAFRCTKWKKQLHKSSCEKQKF